MIRGTIYILVFIAGALAGSQFPAFSNQYHQRLQARYEQVSIDLAPFEAIADRYHGGSMEALVQHHLDSNDPTFYAEGEAIQLMLDSRQRLAESESVTTDSYLRQAAWLYQHRDDMLVSTTRSGFQPALLADTRALSFAAGIGLLLAAVAWLVLNLIGYGAGRLLSTKRM